VAPPLATSAVLRMQQELRRAGVLPPEDSSAGAGAGMGGADEDLTLPAPQVDVADTPLRQQLSRAGLHRGGDAAWFFATKIGLALVLSLGSLALLDPLALSPNGKLLFAAAGAMVGFVLPTAILDLRVQDRQRRLRSQLPDYIDMIVTCLEAGMGLDRAVQRATVELRSYAPDLCEELSITVGQWSAGFDRMAAVAELRRRTGLEDLAEFMGAVEEAGRHGSTITDALRQQAEFMRKGEAARQEAWAKRVPTLVIVLVLIFIVPPAFVVLLGSSVVQAVRLLWPALQ
jgi:tight adherence protein C